MKLKKFGLDLEELGAHSALPNLNFTIFIALGMVVALTSHWQEKLSVLRRIDPGVSKLILWSCMFRYSFFTIFVN